MEIEFRSDEEEQTEDDPKVRLIELEQKRKDKIRKTPLYFEALSFWNSPQGKAIKKENIERLKRIGEFYV